ncbi:MAG: hypothetical protein AB7E37_08560, partial [Candidatus Altimarinota bacterium]
IKEIIYSKENIKISFYYDKNLKNFETKNSPARRQADGASVSSESPESLNSSNKIEFVSQSMAPDRKLLQTFDIILPNLIHQSKERNLGKGNPSLAHPSGGLAQKFIFGKNMI